MNNFKISIFKASLIFVSVLVLAAALILFFGPAVPDGKQLATCVVNIHLPIGGLSMNCDSPEFLRLATDPKFLFEPKNDRQSRPGYIMAAWVVSRPFLPFAAAIEKVGFKAMRETPPRFTRPLADYFPAYIAYVLLDIFFFWLSARLFWALFADEKKKISGAVFIFSFIFIFNLIFFYLFWSPHTQVFNIFVPIFCLWAAVRAYQSEMFWNKKIYLLSFLAGLGVLAYPTFLIFFPAAALGIFLREKKISWDFFRSCLLAGFSIIIPMVLWYFIVIFKIGSFYQHEIEFYDYGVWNRSSNFFGLIQQMFLGASEIVKNILTKNLYIFLPGAAASFYLWKKKIFYDAPLSASFFIPFVLTIFLAALTFYPDRVLLSVVLPWLFPIALLAEKKLNPKISFLAAVIFLLGWIAWAYFIGFYPRA